MPHPAASRARQRALALAWTILLAGSLPYALARPAQDIASTGAAAVPQPQPGVVLPGVVTPTQQPQVLPVPVQPTQQPQVLPAAPVTLTATVAPPTTTASSTYTWTLTSTASPTSITVAAPATNTVVQYTVTATQARQSSTLGVTSTVTISNPSPTQMSLATSTAEVCKGPCQTVQLSCSSTVIPPGGSVTCPLTASLTGDPTPGTITARVSAAGGPVSNSAPMNFDFAGAGTNDINKCGTISTSMAGVTTQPSISGDMPPQGGIQICESRTFTFSATFGATNFPTTACTTPATVTTNSNLQLTSGAPISSVATVTATVKCGASAVADITVRSATLNKFTWTLSKTSPNQLTLTRNVQGRAPYSVVATQTRASSSSTIAGTVRVSNTGTSTASITQAVVTVNDGSTGTLACNPPAIAPSTTAVCTYNMTYAAAPAAGTVTATITFGDGSTITTTQPAQIDFTTATVSDIGRCVVITDTFSTTGIGSLQSGLGLLPSGFSVDPPDGKPPSDSSGGGGLEICESRTFNYNLLMTLQLCGTNFVVTNTARLLPRDGTFTAQTAGSNMNLIVTGCDVLPTVTLVSPQTWSANTFTWTMRKQASPSQVSVPFGRPALVNYQLFFTKTQTAGNYWLSGTINIVNTQTGTVGIRTVLLQSTTGASQTPSCFAGSSGGFVSDGSFGSTGTNANILLGPGQTNTCQFNLSMATGASPPSGSVTVQVTTVGGQTATSAAIPVDFTAPTQAWNINDCVQISDSATVQPGSSNWTPQVTGLPQALQWCTANTYSYTAALGAPPRTVQCDTPLTVSNNAVAQPQGGGAQLTSTASATVTITGCPAATPPSPSPSSITTQAVNKTTVTVSVPKTTIAGSYQWSISKTASAASGSVSMAYNGTRTVSYTVQATKIPVASTYTLTVSISVNNPGSSSLTLTSLNAVLGPASVPAVCPGGNLVVPAGGTLTCTFPVNYNLGAKPGQISAVAGFPGGGTATPATPASFDWSTADTRGATGQCAVVTDVLAPQGLPPAAGLKVSGNKPAATAGTPVCDSTAYQYSIELGPFTAGDCGSYRLVNTASVNPTTGSQETATAESSVQVTVGGCTAQLQGSTDIQVGLAGLTPVKIRGATWSLKGSVSPATRTLAFGARASTFTYTTTWDKTATVTASVGGRVVITNPTTITIRVSKVELLIIPGDKSPQDVQLISCPSNDVSRGASLACPFNITLENPVDGQIVVVLRTQTGDKYSSTPASYKLADAKTVSGNASSGCADISTGLVVGIPLSAQGGATRTVTSRRVCVSGSATVAATVGPFTPDQCGSQTLTHYARAAPAVGSQVPVTAATSAQLVVTGCPPKPASNPTVTAYGVDTAQVIKYEWAVNSQANVAATGISMKPGATRGARFRVTINRSGPGNASFVMGRVDLTGTASAPVRVTKAEVAAFTTGGDRRSAPLNCPAAAVRSGIITVPAKPQKLVCTFNITGLSSYNGAVLPMVYTGGINSSPIAANSAPFDTQLKDAVVLADCAYLGGSWSLTNAAGSTRGVPQPVMDKDDRPKGFTCQSGQGAIGLTFGPFSSTQCGTYQFASTATVAPANSSGVVSTTSKFPVTVTGC